MPAFVTDQFRIFNASNFIESVENSSNSYYVFLGLSNSTTPVSGFGRNANWDTSTPNPIDSFDYLNHYKSTILFGKKITSANIRRVIKRIDWVSGKQYEMYRPDYSIINPSPKTGSMRLYDTDYYVINSDYRVYICIDNGSFEGNVVGNTSQIEPKFTDLEPTKFSDGYVWKYLYTIPPSDIIKFDSIEYIPIPNNWQTSTDPQIVAVRENGDSELNENQIKKVYIKKQGLGYSTGTISCDLVGDGSNGTASVTIDSSTKITDVIVTSGGKNYTFATVNLGSTSGISTFAELVPIIPPSKGHGFDVYKELGADKVLIYIRFDDSSKDFPIDTKFAQVGILKNPTIFNSSNLFSLGEFSGVYSMKLNATPTGTITVGDRIQQTVNGGTAYGYVVSYDKETFVLKYSQDRSLYYNGFNGGAGGSNNQDFYGMSSLANSSGTVLPFTSGLNSSEVSKVGGGFNATIDSTFNENKVTILNKIVNLGVTFNNGLANPEINNRSGDIIYIDNRSTVTRSSRQKEDVKIILEF